MNYTVFLKEMKDNRRVLITGGSGFLGSHLANELSKNGNQVTHSITSLEVKLSASRI